MRSGLGLATASSQGSWKGLHCEEGHYIVKSEVIQTLSQTGSVTSALKVKGNSAFFVFRMEPLNGA